MVGPKGLGVSQILTKKEVYKGNVFAKKTILGRGPFSAPVGSEVIFAFDEGDAALTITRAEPGNETAFLFPSPRCHIFSREQKVSITAGPQELEVDFVVLVPVPVFQLSYADEDLHVERRLTVELTENGEMSMLEVLYDKTKNTITAAESADESSGMVSSLRDPTSPPSAVGRFGQVCRQPDLSISGHYQTLSSTPS